MYSEYLNQLIVLDTNSCFIYIGTLSKMDEQFLELIDVDAHDIHDTPSTKEIYIQNIAKNGLHPNRKKVKIEREKIISVSLLSEIL